MQLTIDARHISLNEIINAKNVTILDDSSFEKHFSLGHTFLMNEIQDGKPIYGVTTGYGSSGKNYLTYEQSAILQQKDISHWLHPFVNQFIKENDLYC